MEALYNIESKIGNKTRIVAMDLARFFSIVFMIFVHVLELMIYEESVNSYNGVETFLLNLNEYLGGCTAAPLFMFIMGPVLFYK